MGIGERFEFEKTGCFEPEPRLPQCGILTHSPDCTCGMPDREFGEPCECNCTSTCPSNCHGECGCELCHLMYMDFLSSQGE